MNIPEIQNSRAAASTPANRATANSGTRSAQPTPKFKSVFGSMVSEDENSTSSSNSNKRSSSQNTNPVPLPSAAAQPIVLPSGLQIQLLAPSATQQQEPDASEAATDTAAGQDSQNPSLPLPVINVSSVKSAPASSSAPSKSGAHLTSAAQTTTLQPAIPQFTAAQTAAQATVESHQLAGQSLPRNEDQSGGSASAEALAQPLAMKSENTAPLSNTVLAFSAKLTSLPGSQTQTANAAQSRGASTQPATTSLSSSSETPAINASTANQNSGQQADTNGDTGSPLFAKQFQKLVTKYQADDGAQQASTAPIANSTATQDAGASTLTRPLTATPEPVSSVSAKNSDVAPASQPSDARPAAAALPDTNTTAKSEPIKDLSLKLGTTPGNQVEVKIQDRAGEVHVSVLSSSPTLTTDLRQQVGDLVGKLDRAGYHAETFRPSASNASQQSSTQSDSSEEQNLGGRQQQQQDDSREQTNARQRRASQPQWLQEMNKNLGLSAIEGVQS